MKYIRIYLITNRILVNTDIHWSKIIRTNSNDRIFFENLNTFLYLNLSLDPGLIIGLHLFWVSQQQSHLFVIGLNDITCNFSQLRRHNEHPNKYRQHNNYLLNSSFRNM